MDIERELLHAPISSLQLKAVVTVPVETTLAQAVQALQDHHVGCLLVTGPDGTLLGIFTERDLLTKVAGHGLDWSKEGISSFMTFDPETLRSADPIAWALNLMHLGGYRHVPLVDEDRRAVGVVSVKDVVDLIVDLFPAAVLNLPPRPRRAPESEDAGEE